MNRTALSAIRIAFMGTATFAIPSLSRIFEERYPIVGVVTQPDKPRGRGRATQPPPVKRKALETHLPVYQPASLKDPPARELFETLMPDVLVVVAYGKILPKWLLALPRFGAVNVHGSLLPKYRGAAPVQWAVASGETETGVCTMLLDEGLDTGPVFLAERTPIGVDETAQEVSARLAQIGSGLVVRTLSGLIAGDLKPVPQDDSQATLAPMLKREDGFIDWNLPARTIHNRVRAFSPWPGAVARFRHSTCKILKTKTTGRVEPRGRPGTIVATKSDLAVCGGDSTLLEVLELQVENRKPVSGAAFLNGARIQPGEKFCSIVDNET